MSELRSTSVFRSVLIVVLQVGLIVVLVGAGWLIYRQLPATATEVKTGQPTTTLQILIRQPP